MIFEKKEGAVRRGMEITISCIYTTLFDHMHLKGFKKKHNEIDNEYKRTYVYTTMHKKMYHHI
jgi:hypothetical protein